MEKEKVDFPASNILMKRNMSFDKCYYAELSSDVGQVWYTCVIEGAGLTGV